jgi:DNA-binding NarL/FixJ family response regulator
MTIKILVVDDHVNVRKQLRKVLNRNPKMEVVGEASGGKEALNLTKQLNPDVLLLDVEMPDMNGYEVARLLTKGGTHTRVLAVSGYDEKRYILGMFANGAVGYLTKDEAPDQLLTAVKEIAAGRKGWISPKVAKKLGVPDRGIGRDTIPVLSPLELAILKCLGEGKTDSEILKNLDIDLDRLTKNVQSILAKLRVSSRWEAVLRAMQEDLI